MVSDYGSGRTENKYVTLDKTEVVNTVILPILVNLCRP